MESNCLPRTSSTMTKGFWPNANTLKWSLKAWETVVISVRASLFVLLFSSVCTIIFCLLQPCWDFLNRSPQNCGWLLTSTVSMNTALFHGTELRPENLKMKFFWSVKHRQAQKKLVQSSEITSMRVFELWVRVGRICCKIYAHITKVHFFNTLFHHNRKVWMWISSWEKGHKVFGECTKRAHRHY